MTRDLVLSLLMTTFFTAGLGFWTYSWWNRDRAISLIAVTYAAIFWASGFAVLVLWRLTDL